MLQPGKWYTVGASADCDIVLDQPAVSGQHAQLARDGDGFQIYDSGSSNGLFVNEARVSDAAVGPQDVIGLGSFRITVAALAQLVDRRPTMPVPVPQRAAPSTKQQQPAERLLVGDDLVVIGRDSGLDVQVDSGAVSSRHARLFRSAGRTVLEDLGSRNGTFVRHAGSEDWVNYRTCVVRRGDQVKIGGRIFEPIPAASERQDGARLDVRDLSLTVTHRGTGQPLTLLNDVSFTALDGEVIGILGPSGSGKTSLLNVMAGYDAPTSGEVLVQGQPLHQGQLLRPEMGTLVGHAPQFDVAHAQLTVREAIRYSAELRGPAAWSPAEVEKRVADAIEAVDLVAKADVALGSESRKTLSGGQKKRVNIAMELVLDPPVLLLDEPTSGLSAQDTMDLVRLLRRLAGQGRTICLTIHQPSYAAFIQMDQVLVLEEGGHVAWFGPAAVDSFEYFGVTDREPGALLEAMPRKPSADDPGTWALRYGQSETKERFVTGRAHQLDSEPPAAWPIRPQTGGLGQFLTLLGRNLKLKFRDSFFLLLAFVVPIAVAAIFVLVLGAKIGEGEAKTHIGNSVAHEYMVVLTIMAAFFGALAAALEVVHEIPILRRERRGGVALLSYVASKAVTYAVPAVVFPGLAVLTIHLLGDGVLGGDALQQWAILSSAFFASTAAGLLLSSVLASAQTVVIFAVFYGIVQVVFSVFVPLHMTYADPPRSKWLQVASVPMTARWTLAGLVSIRDLCDTEVKLIDGLPGPSVVTKALQEAMYIRDCKAKFYQDHGIKAVQRSEDRTDGKHRRRALGANLLLAMLGLMGTWVALLGRSRGTQ